jgi:hypothetical protein
MNKSTALNLFNLQLNSNKLFNINRKLNKFKFTKVLSR